VDTGDAFLGSGCPLCVLHDELEAVGRGGGSEVWMGNIKYLLRETAKQQHMSPKTTGFVNAQTTSTNACARSIFCLFLFSRLHSFICVSRTP
jgi:hypothetical protein